MTDKEMLHIPHAQTTGCTDVAEHTRDDEKKESTVRLQNALTAGYGDTTEHARGDEKIESIIHLQDTLTGALVGLARAIDDPATASAETWAIMTDGLLATAPDACLSDAALETMIQNVRAEKARLAPGCSICTAPCGRTADYDMQALWTAEEAVRALKLRILADLREIVTCIGHTHAQQPDVETEVYPLLCEALFKIGYDESTEALLATVQKVEETKSTWGVT